MKKAIVIIFLVLVIDQLSKIWIKTNFFMYEDYEVFSWFHIRFVENNGMAWGAEFGGKAGKLFLTIFRLFAITGIGYWLFKTIKEQKSTFLIVALSLIFSGALGNIIDSVIYGIIFNTPGGQEVASLFSDQPYGELFYGKVVDMLYFPIYTFDNGFTFFNAIFNVADTAISTGIGIMLVFNKRVFPADTENKEKSVVEVNEAG